MIQIRRWLPLISLIAITLNKANAQLPAGNSLLPNVTSLFKTSAVDGVSSGIELIDVNGQPFTQAYRITTGKQPGSTGFTAKTSIDSSVRKGGVLLLSFYTRSLESRRETGESFMESRLDRFPSGKYEWPPLLERGISFGSQWSLPRFRLRQFGMSGPASWLSSSDVATLLRFLSWGPFPCLEVV